MLEKKDYDMKIRSFDTEFYCGSFLYIFIAFSLNFNVFEISSNQLGLKFDFLDLIFLDNSFNLNYLILLAALECSNFQPFHQKFRLA